MPEVNAGSSALTNRTVVERKSDRELVVTRMFDAPVHIVFEAWSKPELFQRWWVPKSAGLTFALVRDGCAYRGRVSPRVPPSDVRSTDGVLRHVQGSDAEQAHRVDERRRRPGRRDHGDVREDAGKTLVTLHERYPTKAALEEALAGSAEGLPEQFAQLDGLLAGRS